MLTRLTITTMIIALFGFGFGTLVKHDGRTGGRAYAGQTSLGQTGSDCFPQGAFCGSGERATLR